MANVGIVAASPQVIKADHFPPILEPIARPKPIIIPGGSVAAGGPRGGQLFPVGNR